MSQQGQKLSKQIPEALRAARIGTCYDSITRALLSDTQAFDLGALAGKNLLKLVDGFGEQSFSASSNSTADSDKAFFSLDVNARGDFGFCKVAAGFNMTRASANAAEVNTMRATISYLFKGQSVQLQRASPNTLYRCATEDFQDAYDKIMNAEAAQEVAQRYLEFIQFYGTGCITTLHLTSGTIATVSISDTEAKSVSAARYGASFMINFPPAGISSAANWGKEVQKAVKQGNVELSIDTFPQNSPTHEWAQQLSQRLANIGIEKLAESATFAKLPEVKDASSPSFPASKKASDKKIPSPPSKSYTEKLKEELLKQEKFDKSWDAYVEALKKASEEVTPGKVVAGALAVAGSGSLLKSQRGRTAAKSRHLAGNVGAVPRKRSASVIAASQWDLGGYLPCNYEITPWTKLFPSLDKVLTRSFSSINVAKIMTYFYTRLQFSQYLYFLKDVGCGLCENEKIDDDAILFKDFCNDLLGEIEKVMNRSKLSGDDFVHLVRSFEGRVRGSKQFRSEKVYEKFFECYSYFSRIPYGFIFLFNTPSAFLDSEPKDDGKFYITSLWLVSGNKNQKTALSISREKSLTEMLADAVRQYPILTKSGKLRLASYTSTEYEFQERPGNPWIRDIQLARRPGAKRDIAFYTDLRGDMKDPMIFLANLGGAYRTQGGTKEAGQIDGDTMFPFLHDALETVTKSLTNNVHPASFKVIEVGHDNPVLGEPGARIRGTAMWENFSFESIKSFLDGNS